MFIIIDTGGKIILTYKHCTLKVTEGLMILRAEIFRIGMNP